jgi:pilus assembly protein Flp/PilA
MKKNLPFPEFDTPCPWRSVELGRVGNRNPKKGKAAMLKLQQFVTEFLKREDGPTAVEYAVMLALIIVVCIAAITTLGSNANSTFTTAGAAINVGS